MKTWRPFTDTLVLNPRGFFGPTVSVVAGPGEPPAARGIRGRRRRFGGYTAHARHQQQPRGRHGRSV